MRTVLLALWAIAGAVEITSSHGTESHAEVRADGSVKAAMMRREKDEHMVGRKEADPDESDVENGDGEVASDDAVSQNSASDGPASNITVTVNITNAANTTGTANTTASTNTTENANTTATTDKKRSVDDTSEKSDSTDSKEEKSGDSDSSEKEEPTKDQQSADSTDSTADSTADNTADSTGDSTGDSASTADSTDSTADSTGDSAAESTGDSAAESPNSADSTEEAEEGNDDSKQSQDETAAFINLKASKPLQHAGSKDHVSSDQQKPATHNTHANVKTGASKAKATASKTDTSSKHHEKSRKHASLLAQDPETTVTTTYYFTLVSTNKYCANAQSGYKKNVGNYKTKACFEYVLAEKSCGKYFDFGVVDGACDCVPKSHAECKEADAENYHVYLVQKGGPEALVEVDDQGMAVKVNGYAVHSHLD